METYALELIKELSKKHQISVAIRKDYENIDYPELSDVKIIPLLTYNLEDDVKRVLNLLENSNFDLIQINNAGFLVIANKIKNISVVAKANGKDFLQSWLTNDREAIRKGLNASNRIVVTSSFINDRLVEMGINVDKIRIVPDGVDCNFFKPKNRKIALLNRLQISKTSLIILSVGRVIDRKNFEAVIDVLPHLNDAYYLIVGPIIDKKYYEKICKRIGDLGLGKRVKFLGQVSKKELLDFYNICDVFVLLSKESENESVEGFGITLLEASSCAKPVIGSKKSGAAGAIVDDKTGYLVNPNNEKELKSKLFKLIKNPELRIKLGKEGRKFVVKERTWKRCAGETEKIYFELCRNI
jgi:glycosyltransferase involved in cell wall biosynthesis